MKRTPWQLTLQEDSNLVKEKKGILILDLDHTLFQVTLRPINKEFPDLEVWNFDTEVEHSGKLLESKTYWFPLDPKGPPFYIHLRPGVYSFLERASKMFELYAYTQGTNEYARRILPGIDPNGEFFGKPLRLIAREVDPNTGHATRKNLSRVFPNEEGLVVIIDDRDDVWDSSASAQNLIKLTPFLFFQDKEREKLFSVTPTSDALFNPNPRPVSSTTHPSDITDRQLAHLESLLSDLHSEVFFASHSQESYSFPSVLVQRKKELFSNHCFFKLIKQTT